MKRTLLVLLLVAVACCVSSAPLEPVHFSSGRITCRVHRWCALVSPDFWPITRNTRPAWSSRTGVWRSRTDVCRPRTAGCSRKTAAWCSRTTGCNCTRCASARSRINSGRPRSVPHRLQKPLADSVDRVSGFWHSLDSSWERIVLLERSRWVLIPLYQTLF